MSKVDSDFVNLSQDYELKDWLYNNGFSKKEENYKKVVVIIGDKLKKGITANNITWAQLDKALKDNKEWFSGLDAIGG
ncbi:hypothetical protein [Pseudomonas viridiflava]|uniref:hypothetical protein n=1 Tax=Pseudomonas viridiflava TaxID=33069 RepID=UPI000F01EF98|nr:hypothetical protein [Pseudomonas viridiflava]MEE4124021.1 hypothetical protein [Pseudomonas viridiflava]